MEYHDLSGWSWHFQMLMADGLTQEVPSAVLEAKVLEECGERGKQNGAGVAQNSGYTSSVLVPALRQTSRARGKVFHRHLQVGRRGFKK